MSTHISTFTNDPIRSLNSEHDPKTMETRTVCGPAGLVEINGTPKCFQISLNGGRETFEMPKYQALHLAAHICIEFGYNLEKLVD